MTEDNNIQNLIKTLYLLKVLMGIYFIVFLVNFLLTFYFLTLGLSVFFLFMSWIFYKIEAEAITSPWIYLDKKVKQTERYLKTLPRRERRLFIREMKKK